MSHDQMPLASCLTTGMFFSKITHAVTLSKKSLHNCQARERKQTKRTKLHDFVACHCKSRNEKRGIQLGRRV